MNFMSARGLPVKTRIFKRYRARPGETQKNKNDEKKYNDTDDGGNRIFLLRAK
jgi:hypothetical protein